MYVFNLIIDLLNHRFIYVHKPNIAQVTSKARGLDPHVRRGHGECEPLHVTHGSGSQVGGLGVRV